MKFRAIVKNPTNALILVWCIAVTIALLFSSCSTERDFIQTKTILLVFKDSLPVNRYSASQRGYVEKMKYYYYEFQNENVVWELDNFYNKYWTITVRR
jgi:hypothetical protein